ncbi:MAG: N-acetylmuramoyl-L-alanine amidase [Terriglobales bacterium]
MKTSSRTRLLVLALAALLVAMPAAAKKRSVVEKKKIALADFAEAERLRDALTRRPDNQRTRREYTRVIDAYRKVYYLAPTSQKADDAIVAVAELFDDMAAHFDDDKAAKSAIGQYEFLRREYPGSKYRADALFTIAEIYRDDLNDTAQARATFEDFLKHYPHSDRAQEARAALKDLDEPKQAAKAPKEAKAKPERESVASSKRAEPAPEEQPKAKPAAAKSTDDSDADIAAKPAPAPSGPPVLVSGIRYWSTTHSTRVAVELAGDLKFDSDRIDHPDRIYFDLHNSRLASALVNKTIAGDDGYIHKIRVAQYQPGETRVVLEVDHDCDYSAFLMPNPMRLIIDIHGKKPEDAPARATETASVEKPPQPQPAPAAVPVAATPKPKMDVPLESAAEVPARLPELKPRVESVSVTKPARSERPETSSKRTKRSTARTNNEMADAREAKPTADGDRSLIRALGLKIGRIVVDAGHGGHDTGTIGPNGLLEKDLVLDVALRLGKLLENRLGADVVYTRDDDTFIPLQERTAIANRDKADLFISVHANSSRDSRARGVETYYLNFTTSADALEVAARENAVSDQSIHELQDLVKQIALKEKVEESREFAADVQDSMSQALKVHNRGVKKAPFIVLIGANMPSILAEISFVSNPTDAKKLKTAAYRQKIAESLYRGVARYVNGLSGLKLADKDSSDSSPSADRKAARKGDPPLKAE